METIIDFLNNNSGAVQGISTLILVIITAYYSYQTKETVSEIRNQKNLSILPIIIPGEFKINYAHADEPACVDCTLENIGVGAAKNIYISFVGIESEEIILASDHAIDFIKSKDRKDTHIHFPAKQIKEVKYEDHNEDGLTADLLAKIEFEDFADNHYITTKFCVLKKDQKGNLSIESALGSLDFTKL